MTRPLRRRQIQMPAAVRQYRTVARRAALAAWALIGIDVAWNLAVGGHNPMEWPIAGGVFACLGQAGRRYGWIDGYRAGMVYALDDTEQAETRQS